MQNIAMLDMTNSSSETLILSPKEVLGILGLRSLGYYKYDREYYNRTEANFTNSSYQTTYVTSLII